MWDKLFFATNAIAVIAWLLLAFGPRKPLAHSAILYLGVGLLCLIYAACFITVLSKDGLAPGASGTSVAGIRAFFANDAGLVIGWTHYLALDLFTGMWIARDADAKLFSRLVQLPFLILTWLAGPIGLLAWLITRERRSRQVSRG